MTLTQTLSKLKRSNWRGLDRLVRRAWEAGYQAGLSRAHGSGRRGRTIRADATVDGLLHRIESHFGLDRYGFEVRVVHSGSKKRVPARDPLSKYRIEESRRRPMMH